MLFIGDIHGRIKEYLAVLKKHRIRLPYDHTIQLGDFGAGFVEIPKLYEEDHFIRGNHDDPAKCKLSSNYLGDYGYKEIDGIKIFFVSGAWSIDAAYRTPMKSWWPDEELSYPELISAMELYEEVKPNIVLTHDGPNDATIEIIKKHGSLFGTSVVYPTRTGGALTRMFETHQPDKWFFGHWHQDWKQKIGHTKFQCLPELGCAII
jgi:predicted phosphodiesterase